MSLPIITVAPTLLPKALLIAMLSMGLVTKTSEAVEITASTEFIAPIINGESAFDWSPDGARVMLAEFHEADQRIHLCVYSVLTGKKEKCIYSLRSEPDSGIHSINWTDEYIHVAAGFHDAAVIFRLPIPDWKRNGFNELSMANKILPETYSDPAWDKWESGLFFSGKDERYGIQFLSMKGGRPKKYVSGLYPAVTRNYLWYTSITEDGNLAMDGISRIEKTSHKQQKLTTKYVDVSVSPRQDEKAALFIRRDPNSDKTTLYAYVEGKGVIGPLLSNNQKAGEDLMRVQLSPNGKQALLTSSFPHKTDALKTVVTLKLLSVRW